MSHDPHNPVDWNFDETTDVEDDAGQPEPAAAPSPSPPPEPSPPRRQEGTPLTPADFPAFFESLWHYPPFDWQTRLLEQVRTRGWPSTLDLPTGSGKTAALDVALFALALDAFDAPESRHQFRRIALVVDRRVIVDQAYERAVAIARALHSATDGILADVARALRTLSGYPSSLPVFPAILRGGMPRETEWARTPSQPVILVSTVDQVGSRLLFRGYGVSDRMKPLHAGLLGRDTLYLLDEVHLARPFEETLDAVSRFYAESESSQQILPRPLRFVRMSATVAERLDDTFGLQEADRRHDVLARRLQARKIAVLRQVKTPRDPAAAREALAKASMREVQRLAKGTPRAIGAIVNRVDTARRLAGLAREALGDTWTVKLLTGRMRPLDRERQQAGLIDRIRAGRTRSGDDERVLLVSTQAVEAGADFDFDALVTECASLDALRQRFGRLDRLGELGSTQAVILAGSSSVDDKAESDPIYGEALRATWQWLNEGGELSEEHDGRVVDFGIEAMSARLRESGARTVEDLIAPRARAPVLVASHLDRWAQTSRPPSADPDVAPFLHGVDRGAPEVQIVWRADVEPSLLNDAGRPFVRGVLAVAPPSVLEALSVPLWTATRWLAAVAERSGAEGESSEAIPALGDVEGAVRDDADGKTPSAIAPAALWRGDETAVATGAADIRPGDTLVVPSSYGGLDPVFDCWDPDATDPVIDHGDEAQLLQRGRAVIRWSAVGGWGRNLSAGVAAGPQVNGEEVDREGPEAERDAFRQWREAARNDPDLPTWAAVALDALSRGQSVSRLEPPKYDSNGDQEPAVVWRATWHRRRIPARRLRDVLGLPSIADASDSEPLAATEDDEGSFLGSRVPLSFHLRGVRDFAHTFASSLGLPDRVVEDLALAGWLHDLGKADRRFQLMLHGGDPVEEAVATEPLAKSAVAAPDRDARERARQRSGYPKGTRHELMSLALVQHEESLRAGAHDWDLVLHLVASHHGWCRPFPPPVGDPEPVSVSVSLDDGVELAASSNHGLARLDSGIADRFWRLERRYGWWGLAWLETILRLADHRESEREAREDDNG